MRRLGVVQRVVMLRTEAVSAQAIVYFLPSNLVVPSKLGGPKYPRINGHGAVAALQENGRT